MSIRYRGIPPCLGICILVIMNLAPPVGLKRFLEQECGLEADNGFKKESSVAVD